MDRCFVSSKEGTVLVCSGEKAAEPDGEAYNTTGPSLGTEKMKLLTQAAKIGFLGGWLGSALEIR